MVFFSTSGGVGHRLVRLPGHLRRLSSTSAPLRHPVPDAELRRLARAGRFADIDALLTPHLGSHPAAVLHSFSSLGMLDRAAAALSSLPSPSPAALLNALLLPLLRRRGRAHAHLVPTLAASFAASVPPDAATYGILAKSLCLTRGAAAALPLLDEMRSRSIPPSVVLFTTLIDAFYKEDRPDRAEQIWHRMGRDEGLAPDAAAYNARITYAAARGGGVAEVEAIVAEMRDEAGLAPDTITFNCLMAALARHGRLPEAVRLYRGMEAEGCTPNCATYRCLVAALCRGGRVAEAEEVLGEGLRRGKVTDVGVAKPLVEEMARRGTGRAAREAVRRLQKSSPADSAWNWAKLERMAETAARKEERKKKQEKGGGGGDGGYGGGEQPVAE